MRPISRTLTTVGVIAAVVAIGILLGWLASRPPAPQLAASDAKKLSGTMPRTNTLSRGRGGTPMSSSNPTEVMIPIDFGPGTNLLDWETRIGDILSDNSDVDDKARKLVAMFPQMPVEGQVEAAHHISNLLDDKDYPEFSRYLTNSTTSEDVLDVLMSDVLNRPNSMKMPVLLDVASNPDHPKAAEAKETLELYLEEDYGTNWMVWREKLADWLKTNPD